MSESIQRQQFSWLHDEGYKVKISADRMAKGTLVLLSVLTVVAGGVSAGMFQMGGLNVAHLPHFVMKNKMLCGLGAGFATVGVALAAFTIYKGVSLGKKGVFKNASAARRDNITVTELATKMDKEKFLELAKKNKAQAKLVLEHAIDTAESNIPGWISDENLKTIDMNEARAAKLYERGVDSNYKHITVEALAQKIIARHQFTDLEEKNANKANDVVKRWVDANTIPGWLQVKDVTFLKGEMTADRAQKLLNFGGNPEFDKAIFDKLYQAKKDNAMELKQLWNQFPVLIAQKVNEQYNNGIDQRDEVLQALTNTNKAVYLKNLSDGAKENVDDFENIKAQRQLFLDAGFSLKTLSEDKEYVQSLSSLDLLNDLLELALIDSQPAKAMLDKVSEETLNQLQWNFGTDFSGRRGMLLEQMQTQLNRATFKGCSQSLLSELYKGRADAELIAAATTRGIPVTVATNLDDTLTNAEEMNVGDSFDVEFFAKLLNGRADRAALLGELARSYSESFKILLGSDIKLGEKALDALIALDQTGMNFEALSDSMFGQIVGHINAGQKEQKMLKEILLQDLSSGRVDTLLEKVSSPIAVLTADDQDMWRQVYNQASQASHENIAKLLEELYHLQKEQTCRVLAVLLIVRFFEFDNEALTKAFASFPKFVVSHLFNIGNATLTDKATKDRLVKLAPVVKRIEGQASVLLNTGLRGAFQEAMIQKKWGFIDSRSNRMDAYAELKRRLGEDNLPQTYVTEQ